MITGSYHVFGSGSSWVCWRGDAEEILRFVASEKFKATRRNAGHNGFIGYYEVPDEIVPAGISTDPGAYPGGGGTTGRPLSAVRAEYLESRGLPQPVADALGREWTCEECLAPDVKGRALATLQKDSWVRAAAGTGGAEWLAVAGGMVSVKQEAKK